MQKQDNINEYVGKALRNLRNMKKITLNELADRLNISYQQVQKYETGVNRLGADTLYEVADFLNVDIGVFFPNATLSEPFISDKQLQFLATFDSIGDEKLKDMFLSLIKHISSLDIH